MSSRLPTIIKKFGFFNGLKLYNHLKAKSDAAIQLSILKHPFYFRAKQNTTDSFIFEQIFLKNQYNINVPFEPKIIFDLGANVGYSAVFFANRYPNAQILSIEPDNGNYEAAKKNLDPYKNVKLIKGAAWHVSEDISLVDDGYGEAAFMVKAGESKNMVRGYTIEDMMKMTGVDSIDILKIDIEGAEKEIFENGADKWLPVTKLIIVETHDRYKKGSSTAVFNSIGKYDFSLELCGENLILYNNALVNAYK